MVTQPKSIATVVAVLPVPGSKVSTPTDAAVISASVVSGAISEIAPTVVVLPTAKPPATTILTGTGGLAARPLGERTESTYHSQDGRGVIGVHGVLGVHVEVAGGAQVVDQDPGHVEVQAQPGGDLGDGHRLLAQRDDRLELGGQPVRRGGRPALVVDPCGHLGLPAAVGVPARDPAGGEHERPGRRGTRLRQRAGLRCRFRPGQGYPEERPDPRGFVLSRTTRKGHCWTAFFSSTMSRGVSAPPARLAKRVIS